MSRVRSGHVFHKPQLKQVNRTQRRRVRVVAGPTPEQIKAAFKARRVSF